MEFVLKAKNTIKRIAAISAITLMGATAAAGAVAAADLSQYPNLLVEDGLWAAQIVMGLDAKPADVIGATNLAVAITNEAGAAATTTVSTVEGGAKLETADNKLNFYEEIYAPRSTLTDSQLPALLADGQYTNDKGVTFGYTQQIELQANAKVQYNEYDDVSDSPDAYVYQTDGIELLRYKMIFTNAAETDITSNELADFKDTTLTILGKDYEITDADSVAAGTKVTLYLMGGAAKAAMFEGDTATYTIDGVNYEVEVPYVGSTTTKLKINGELTKELSEGQTDKVAGITIGIKEVLENEAGEVSAGRDSVEFYLGANKITMVDDIVTTTTASTALTEIKVSEDTIDGVYVEIGMTEVTNGGTASALDNTDVWELNTLTLYYYPDDPMYVYKDHPYVDPALGDWKIELTQIVTENEETIKVNPDSSDRIKVTIPMSAGEVDVPGFYYSSSVWYLGKDSDKVFFNDETSDVFVDGDEYFVVSSSSNKESYLMQIAKVDYTDNQLTFKDVMTGDKYMVTYTDDNDQTCASDGTFTIGSLTIDIGVEDLEAEATFNLTVDMDDGGDLCTDLNVPFYTKGGATVKLWNKTTGSAANATATTFDANVDLDDDGNDDDVYCEINQTFVYMDFGSGTASSADSVYEVGNNFSVTRSATTAYGWFNGIRFSIIDAANTTGGDFCDLTFTREAGVTIIEEYQDEDTEYGAVYIQLGATSAGNTDVTDIKYTDRGGYDTDDLSNDTDDADFSLNAILDTDVSEDYTEYGTKCTLDTTSDQSNGKCVYTDSEAYADVWFSPAGAVVTTGGTSGGGGYTMPTTTIAVSDAEANTAKPLILVGGPCVNKLTAQALGLSYPACGASSTIPENAAIIKLVENAFDSKVALVVAGWEASDTTAALNILKDYKAYSANLKGTGVKVVGTTITALGTEATVT